MPRPFRFGFQSYSASSSADLTARARQAEALGFSSFLLADHYLGPGPVLTANHHPVQDIASVPAMAYAAAVTDKIRIGCRVMCVDYRNPGVLVKEMLSLDLLSNGRLELGLGAGWLSGEYEAMGIDFESAGKRIERLTDVIALVRAFSAKGEMDLDRPSGVHAVGWEGLPKPIQKPHPPIMIGGGAPRILRMAGREADIVSLNFNNRAGVIGPDGVGSSTADETAKKIEWIREGAGDRFSQIEIEIGAYFTVVTDDAKKVAAGFAAMFGLTPDEVLCHPHALIGTVDAICDELQRRREQYGISYVTVGASVADAFAPVVERLVGK